MRWLRSVSITETEIQKAQIRFGSQRQWQNGSTRRAKSECIARTMIRFIFPLHLTSFILSLAQFYDKIESEKITIWHRKKRKSTFLRSRDKMAVSRKRSDRSRFSQMHDSVYHYIPKGVIKIPSNARSLHILWILQVFTTDRTASNLPSRRDEEKQIMNYAPRFHSKKSAGNSICAYWLAKSHTWLVTRYLRGRNECKEFWEVGTSLNLFSTVDREKKKWTCFWKSLIEAPNIS